MREKKRYLQFEVISDKRISDFKTVKEAIWSSVLDLLGTLGAAKAGIMVLPEKFDLEKQQGVIKVAVKHVDELKMALMTIRKVNNEDVIFRSVRVSGILQKVGG
jgi:RNase P/RNase MRP subunit POP5